MGTFSYVVAKYIPDIVKNEPINVGILVQSEKNTEGKFIENFRPLAARYRDVNIKALKGILDSSRGIHEIKSKNHLKKLEVDFQFHLVFSEPNGIVAGTTKDALNKLYDKFISIDPKRAFRKTISRIQLQSMMSSEIRQKLDRNWVIRKHPVEGPKDHFEFDFAFKVKADSLVTVSWNDSRMKLGSTSWLGKPQKDFMDVYLPYEEILQLN
ncbi:MAG: DUF3037 domain-containing protein [Bacteroidetes bacterium]|nr:DUF3037 domain-containing protein [Bacteroidota bacterium]